MAKPKFQSPTGMHDILPEDQRYFDKIYQVVSEMADFYDFEKIETSLLEPAELFVKGTGESTDIVKKEMYSFKTKGGDFLALRPEYTPSVVRAYIQHGMYIKPQPVKLWYFGPCFRHDRPQAGRFRQFWQFGFEVFGEKSAVVDAQIIQVFYNILKELKLKNLTVEINSVGDSQCRPYYKKLLSNYFKNRLISLCQDCRVRLKENVLRILDCKEEKCQPIKATAPQVLDHLCQECKEHFKQVLEFLDEIKISYNLNPYLVRGLDYYTKTVFEIMPSEGKEGIPQFSLVGGGRYDRLVKVLGGKETAVCGASAGVERIVELMKIQEVKLDKTKEIEVFLAQLGNLAKKKSLILLEEFRKTNIKVSESFGRDSLKVQLARANKVGAKFTLILGQKEALEGKIIIRDMESGNQYLVKLEKAVEEVKKRLRR